MIRFVNTLTTKRCDIAGGVSHGRVRAPQAALAAPPHPSPAPQAPLIAQRSNHCDMAIDTWLLVKLLK